jgi:hypothetical protein
MATAKEEKKMLSELRKSVKALRDMHVGKSVTKMSADELAREKSHHETAVRAMEVKAKRLEGLAKAREARGKTEVKTEAKKAAEPKAPVKKAAVKKEKAKSESSGERETTIGDLVTEKKRLPKKSSDSPKDE